MSNKYISFSSQEINNRYLSFQIDLIPNKNPSQPLIETLEGLRTLKNLNPDQVDNRTSLSIDELAHKAFNNYENRLSFLRKCIDNFLQCFINTKRGKVHQIYQEILCLPQAKTDNSKALTRLISRKFSRADSLHTALLLEFNRIKNIQLQNTPKDSIAKVEKNLADLGEMIRRDPDNNTIARLKALFNLCVPIRSICKELQEQNSDESKGHKEEIEDISTTLAFILTYAVVYLKKKGGPRDLRTIAAFSKDEDVANLLAKYEKQIEQAVETTISH